MEPATQREVYHKLAMTYKWTRTLCDFYTQHLSKFDTESEIESGSEGGDVAWPLIIDPDDVMMKLEVVLRFCEFVGLDQTKLQFRWSRATEKEIVNAYSSIERRMLSTMLDSSGVVQGKTSANLDIDAEAKKWREENGEGEGEKMEMWVRDAIPDYEFMKARKLTPKMNDQASTST